MQPEPEDEDSSWSDELSWLRDLADQRMLAWTTFKGTDKSGQVRGFNEEDAKLFVRFGYNRQAISEGNRVLRKLHGANFSLDGGNFGEQNLSADEFNRLWFHRWRFERGGVNPHGTE